MPFSSAFKDIQTAKDHAQLDLHTPRKAIYCQNCHVYLQSMKDDTVQSCSRCTACSAVESMQQHSQKSVRPIRTSVRRCWTRLSAVILKHSFRWSCQRHIVLSASVSWGWSRSWVVSRAAHISPARCKQHCSSSSFHFIRPFVWDSFLSNLKRRLNNHLGRAPLGSIYYRPSNFAVPADVGLFEDVQYRRLQPWELIRYRSDAHAGTRACATIIFVFLEDHTILLRLDNANECHLESFL